jgi:hypothetical protein
MADPRDPNKPQRNSPEDRRKMRLGPALRANLQRRKSQARARATDGPLDDLSAMDTALPSPDKIGMPE